MSGALDINLGLTDIYIVFKPWDWMRSLDRECGKRRPSPRRLQRLEVRAEED